MKKLPIIFRVCLLTLCVACGFGIMTACTEGNTSGVTEQETDTPTIPDTQPDVTLPEATEAPTEAPGEPEDTVPVEDPTLNVFPTDGENIEIGIFWEPPAEFTTPEQYDWIRDANITFIEITNHRGGNSKENLAKQIALAKERGIDIVYNVSYDGVNLTAMDPDALTEYCCELAKDPTITGIHVVDEPVNPWVYAQACAAISKGGLMPRLNFLPSLATWVFDNYNGHIEDTIIATGKENYGYLCYDHYPFPYNSGTPNMFANLDIVRKIGLKYGVPTAFYLQSIGESGNFRRTNGNEIRYHMAAGMAYGLKSYTYFTWWTTGFCDPKDYAIISPYGEKTDIYDDVAQVNADALVIGPLLRRLDAVEVYHTAGREDGITVCTAEDVPIFTNDGRRMGIIISLMTDRETGRDYVMLVNKDYTREVTATFTLTDAFTHLYNCTNGSYEALDIASGEVTFTFKKGGYVLLAAGQHDNIVDDPWDVSANMAEGKAPAVSKVNPGNGYYAYTITDGIRDNSTVTALGWKCPNEQGYAEVDLGRVTTVNRVDLYPTGTNYDRGGTFPRDFTIEVSTDRENWIKVVEKTDYTEARTAIPTFTFDAVKGRYVRLNVTKGTGDGFEIAEFEVYNDDGNVPAPDNDSFYTQVGSEAPGTNVAFNRGASVSSYVNGWEAYKLVDGKTDSGWTSGLNRHNTENGEEWLVINLATTYTLDKVVMHPRPGDEYFPKVYMIEVSEDGVNFETVYNGALPEIRPGNNTIEVTFDEVVTARYVRVRGTVLRDKVGFGDGFLFSLMEIEIYNR